MAHQLFWGLSYTTIIQNLNTLLHGHGIIINYEKKKKKKRKEDQVRNRSTSINEL